MFPLRNSVKPVGMQELKQKMLGYIDDSHASDMPEK